MSTGMELTLAGMIRALRMRAGETRGGGVRYRDRTGRRIKARREAQSARSATGRGEGGRNGRDST